MNSQLSLKNISKKYKDKAACVDINLKIENEFFCILGPSGCGKSTLLKIIAGLIQADEGSILINEVDVTATTAHRRNVNTVFQNYALFPHLTVFRNVAFGLELKGIEKSIIKEKVDNYLNLFQIQALSESKPVQISGGQQQRVALARAIINEPKVLLLDEPLAALDEMLRRDLQVELKKIQKQFGISFVYVTHNREEAFSLADRIAVMNKGKIIQIDSPTEIYNKPKNSFVGKFLGELNVMSCKKVSDKEVIAANNGTFKVIQKILDDINTIGIRPENITLSKTVIENQNQTTGTVTDVMFKGSHYCYSINLTDEIVFYANSNTNDFSIGEKVILNWNLNHTLLFNDI